MKLNKLKRFCCLVLSTFIVLGETNSVTAYAAEDYVAEESIVAEEAELTDEETTVTEETTEGTEEATEVAETEIEETEEAKEVAETEIEETEEATEVAETEIEETEEVTEVAETEIEETEEATEVAETEIEETEEATEEAEDEEELEVLGTSIVGTLKDSDTYTLTSTSYGNYLIAFTASQNGYVSFSAKGLTQLSSSDEVRVMSSTTAAYDNYITPYYQIEYGSTTTLPTIGVKAGTTYYLYVYDGTLSGVSTRQIQFTSNFTASEYWEKEQNDTIGTANTIKVNKAYNGTTAISNDEDYYKFTLSEAGYVSLNFKHNALSDTTSKYYKIELSSADASYTYDYFYSTGADTSINGTKIGLAKGTYSVRVYSYNLDTGIYTLKVNFTASSTWETENNGDTSVADKISVNKEYNGTFTDTSDRDYYKFTLDADGYIEINFKHANTGNTNNFGYVYLYDKNGNEITYFKSLGTNKSISSEKCGLKSGTYYIGVRASSAATTTTYTLKVSYKESAYWEKEDNGDTSAATKIKLGKDYNGTSKTSTTDYDYYKFTLDEKTWVNISFSHASTGSTSQQWSVYLYDKSGNTVTKDARGTYFGGALYVKGTATYSSMGNIQLAKGTYYVKVYGYTSSEPYKVNVSKVNIKAPTISSVKSASYNSIKVKWNTVAGADQYIIYRSTSKNGTYSKVKTVSAGTTSYTDKKLTTGKTYYYKIKASGTTSKKTTSGYSGVKSAKPVPATPTVTLASSTKNQMKVSWKEISGASGYEVYRATKKDGEYKKIKTITKGSTVSYTDKSAKSGKTYYYKVRAYRTVNGKKVYGSYSSVVSKKTK